MYRKSNYKTSNDLIINQKSLINKETYINDFVHYNESKQNKPKLNMNWETIQYANSADPQVWGPSFWFILHNSSSKYPHKPSPIWKERMKGFILGIPVMIPCEICRDHAISHIQNNYDNLDLVVSNRENLFNFFVDFHNNVNRRYNKPEMNYDEAYDLYTNSAIVTKLSYNHIQDK